MRALGNRLFVHGIMLFAALGMAGASRAEERVYLGKPVEVLKVVPGTGSAGTAVSPEVQSPPAATAGKAASKSASPKETPGHAVKLTVERKPGARDKAAADKDARAAAARGRGVNGKGAWPDYPEFQKSEELLGWINGYRENPEPKRLPKAIEAMSRLGLLRDGDAAGLYVGFAAGVLGANPEIAEALVTRMFPRPPEEQGLVIKAIAYSGLADWRGLLEKFVERMPARRKEIERQLFKAAETLETVKLESGPAPIDALWGYHFATGSHQPLERIVGALAWAADKSDAEKLTIGSMAKWTLASNAMRDKRLLDWLREAGAGRSKEIQVQLREVVVAAESFEVSKLRRDALAAIEDVKRRGPQAKPSTWTTAVGAAPTVIGLACVAASVAGQVALGIPCVVSGALSSAVAKHWGQN